jgi:hypothetical protein
MIIITLWIKREPKAIVLSYELVEMHNHAAAMFL